MKYVTFTSNEDLIAEANKGANSVLRAGGYADTLGMLAHRFEEALKEIKDLREHKARMEWLAARAHYTPPSWGYHNGYFQFSVGPSGSDGETPRNFIEAVDMSRRGQKKVEL